MKSIVNDIYRIANRYKSNVKFLPFLFLVILPLVSSNAYYQDQIILIFFWAGLAVAWNMLGGYAGQISLGHTAFFGIGAYTSTILFLNMGISPWIGMFIGAFFSIAVACVIGFPCFKLKGHFFALATIAFAEVLHLLSAYLRDLTNGGVGLLIPFKADAGNFMFESKLVYTYIVLAFLVIVIAVSYFMKKSRFGFHLISLREDEDAAETLGVKTHQSKMIVLLISVFFTSIAGTFYAQYFLFIDPDTVFSITFSIQLALLSIIGGLGTVIGPVLGAFLMIPLDSLLRAWLGGIASGLNFVVYGAVLVVAVMFFPKGLAGWLDKYFKKLRGRESDAEADILSDGDNDDVFAWVTGDDNGNILFESKKIGVSFGGLKAVSGLEFHIKNKELVGLIGPNGAGKTTVFNLISGAVPLGEGEINFDNTALQKCGPPNKMCNRGIGRTYQVVKPFQDLTVIENVMVGAFCRTKKARDARREAMKILDYIGLSEKKDIQAASLTLADRKRLELGRALATKPKLLLLDEVVAGLNPRETDELIRIIKDISDKGVTILMIEHVMKAVMQLSHRIVVINYGEKIAEGTPVEISNNKKVIDAYLGEDYLAKVK